MPLAPSASSAPAPTPATGTRELNDAQRAAVAALTGPVCIIAGAGTGKTTTVTHRIAAQVTSGTFAPREILALTFTAKAAAELRTRLTALGVPPGVEARTFHSAALWMLTTLWPTYEHAPVPRILDNKYRLLYSITRRLPAPYKFRPVRDIATALEYRANQQIDPADLTDALTAAGIEPPLPDDLLIETVAAYDDAKRREGVIDFEDVLTRCAYLLSTHAPARERIRARFRAFTVDEYQDVNPLQQALLDLWVGDRPDICVVGDDHQTIYTFTGASPRYLLDFERRHANTTVVTLTENYRSSPAVIDLANSVAARLGGRPKNLVAATRPDGPPPVARPFDDPAAEAAWVAARCAELHAAGIPWNEMAILYRTRDQSTRFEQALGKAGAPVYVRGRGLLERDAWRQLAPLLAGRISGDESWGSDNPARDVAAAVLALAVERGYAADASGAPSPAAADVGDEEATRQADFAVIVAEAQRLAAAGSEIADGRAFVAAMTSRFGHENDTTGVQLMTLHSAKGLEFDCVFLPELIGGVFPYWKGKRKAPIEEERRLFFVGVTRARLHLNLSWLTGGKRTPSIFLVDAGVVDEAAVKAASRAAGAAAGGKSRPKATDDLTDDERARFEALRTWRVEAAAGKPAYTVLADKALAAIAVAYPMSFDELAACHGVGPAKLERYGDDILGVLRGL